MRSRDTRVTSRVWRTSPASGGEPCEGRSLQLRVRVSEDRIGGSMRITGNQLVAGEKVALAKKFRRELTPCERLLWQELRTNKLEGLHFRRQQVIAGFIIDFYCASARLAIEIDGASHLARTEYDRERDQ